MVRTVLAIWTNHPTSETGRAVVNVPLEELGRRRPRTPHDCKSGQISQCSRSYWGPASKRWILKAIVIVRGHLLTSTSPSCTTRCHGRKGRSKARRSPWSLATNRGSSSSPLFRLAVGHKPNTEIALKRNVLRRRFEEPSDQGPRPVESRVGLASSLAPASPVRALPC